jgi:hypothetical protein
LASSQLVFINARTMVKGKGGKERSGWFRNVYRMILLIRNDPLPWSNASAEKRTGAIIATTNIY